MSSAPAAPSTSAVPRRRRRAPRGSGAALLLALHAPPAALADAVECPPSCTLPECACPSVEPPGGLTPERTPQLVLLTFDDSLSPERFDVADSLSTHPSANGCALRATFFVSTEGTDFWLVQRLYAAGHGIADHTITHDLDLDADLERWRAEVLGARTQLAELAGVAEGDVLGFRAPYLLHEEESFDILDEGGFRWDSSITEGLGGDALSQEPGARLWPYTLDFGSAQVCWNGTCPEEPHPGLWEVPLWTHIDPDGESVGAMDPHVDTADLLGLWQLNFLDRYDGNRAPLNLFLHARWLLEDAGRVEALDEFLGWAASHDDVWFVNLDQLVAFLEDPQDVESAHGFAPFACAAPPGGPETCDGADNDGDGETDEGLVNTCTYDEGEFRTCAACPEEYPRAPVLPLAGGSASIEVTSDWGEGFCAELWVVNDSGSAAYDWTAIADAPGIDVTADWDGEVAAEGDTLAFTPAHWNDELFAGEATSLGFCATRAPAASLGEPAVELYRIGLLAPDGEPWDADGDGIADDVDLCPGQADPDQADADLDGIGDVCDPAFDAVSVAAAIRSEVDGVLIPALAGVTSPRLRASLTRRLDLRVASPIEDAAPAYDGGSLTASAWQGVLDGAVSALSGFDAAVSNSPAAVVPDATEEALRAGSSQVRTWIDALIAEAAGG